jgi:hypothetical protein
MRARGEVISGFDSNGVRPLLHSLTMPITCSIYGLGVQVNVPIAGLAGLPTPERLDVNITLGAMPTHISGLADIAWQEYYVSPVRDQSGRASMKACKLAGGEYFRITYVDGTQIVVDAAGSEVWATWPDPATVEDTATYLLGPCMGFVLRRRGITCLHASAVAVGQQAIALVGPSGTGKSSTAAAFARLGYPVLTDDIVALDDRERYFQVQSAYPRIRLWPESVQSLFGKADALERITPTWDKCFLNLNSPEYSFQREPLPLAAIYFLGARVEAGRKPVIEAVNLREGLMTLVSDTSTTQLMDRPARAKEFELLGRLVQCVPMRRLAPVDDIARISELCHIIIDDFEKLGAVTARSFEYL